MSSPCSLDPTRCLRLPIINTCIIFEGAKRGGLCQVAIPSAEEINEFQKVARKNISALNGTRCVVDGLKIPLQKTGDESMQNACFLAPQSLCAMLDVFLPFCHPELQLLACSMLLALDIMQLHC
jgi:hypothetical protein